MRGTSDVKMREAEDCVVLVHASLARWICFKGIWCLYGGSASLKNEGSKFVWDVWIWVPPNAYIRGMKPSATPLRALKGSRSSVMPTGIVRAAVLSPASPDTFKRFVVFFPKCHTGCGAQLGSYSIGTGGGGLFALWWGWPLTSICCPFSE